MKNKFLLLLLFFISFIGHSGKLPVCKDEAIVLFSKVNENVDSVMLGNIKEYLVDGEDYRNELQAFIKNKYYYELDSIEGSFIDDTFDIKKKEIEYRDKIFERYRKFIQEYKKDELVQNVLLRTIILAFEEEKDKNFTFLKYPSGKSYKSYDFSKVINLCVKFENNYKNDKNIDMVLFIKGYSYVEMNRINEGIYSFKKLVSLNPNSKFVPESHMLMAEYYRTLPDHGRAIEYYRRLIPFKNVDFYQRVLWGYARSLMAIKNYKGAIDNFIELIDLHRGNFNLALLDDSEINNVLNQISLAFFYLGDQLKPDDYFRKIGKRSYQQKIYNGLGKIYEEKNMYNAAINIYRRILNLFPQNEDNPFIHERIVSIFETNNNNVAANIEREKMISLYSYATPWREANKNNPIIIIQVEAILENYFLKIATFHYSNGIMKKNKNDLKKARDVYINYIESFKEATSSKISKIYYYVADICLRLGDFENAQNNYKKAIRSNCRSEINERALLGLISIYLRDIKIKEADKSEDYFLKDEKYKLSGKKNISDEYTRLIKLIDDFKILSVGHDHLCELDLLKAKSLYKHNLFDQSRLIFHNTFKSCDSKSKNEAAQYILGSYVFQKNSEKISQWNKVLKKMGIENNFLFSTGENLVSQDILKKAMDHEQKGELLQAAKTYIELFRKYPTNELSPMSVYKASEIYRKLNMEDRAIYGFNIILKNYEKSDYSDMAVRQLGNLYEDRLEVERALNLYNDQIKKNIKPENSDQIMEQILKIYESLDDTANILRFYLADNKKSDFMTVKKTINLFKKRQQIKRALDFINERVKTEKLNDEQRVYLLNEREFIITKFGTRVDLINHYKLVIKQFPEAKNTKDGVVKYLAKSRFNLLEDEFNDFLKTKISNDILVLENEINKKMNNLVVLQKKYQEIIDLKDPEYEIASLYKIGKAYYVLVQDLKGINLPENYTGGEKVYYTSELDKRIEKLVKSGGDNFRSGMAKARKENIYNPWVVKIQAEMSKNMIFTPEQLIIPQLQVNIEYQTKVKRIYALD